MPNEHYLIVLTGNLREGRSPDQAALILSKAFGIPVEKGKAFFNGSPTPLGKKLDKKLAEKICHYLQEAGADCQLKEMLEAPQWSLIEKEEIKPEKKEAEYESILLQTPPTAPKSDQPHQAETGTEHSLHETVSPTSRGANRAAPMHRPVIKRHEEPPVQEDDAGENEPRNRAINIQTIALTLVLVLALVAGGYLFLFPMEERDSKQTLGMETEKPSSIQNTPNVSDPALRDSEASLTKLKLRSLVQSVRIWMVQFGGGYDTDQVTISRLQRDIGVSDDDMTDAWGTKMRYQPSKDEFSISSAGPDKAFDTADDLIVRQKR